MFAIHFLQNMAASFMNDKYSDTTSGATKNTACSSGHLGNNHSNDTTGSQAVSKKVSYNSKQIKRNKNKRKRKKEAVHIKHQRYLVTRNRNSEGMPILTEEKSSGFGIHANKIPLVVIEKNIDNCYAMV